MRTTICAIVILVLGAAALPAQPAAPANPLTTELKQAYDARLQERLAARALAADVPMPAPALGDPAAPAGRLLLAGPKPSAVDAHPAPAASRTGLGFAICACLGLLVGLAGFGWLTWGQTDDAQVADATGEPAIAAGPAPKDSRDQTRPAVRPAQPETRGPGIPARSGEGPKETPRAGNPRREAAAPPAARASATAPRVPAAAPQVSAAAPRVSGAVPQVSAAVPRVAASGGKSTVGGPSALPLNAAAARRRSTVQAAVPAPAAPVPAASPAAAPAAAGAVPRVVPSSVPPTAARASNVPPAAAHASIAPAAPAVAAQTAGASVPAPGGDHVAHPGPSPRVSRIEIAGNPQIDRSIAEAWGLMDRGDYEAGRLRLSEAQRLAARSDREDIRAEFSLGLASAVVAHDWPAAERHFGECLKRHPEDVATLNNLALARLRVHRRSESLKLWESALAEGSAPEEIVQNLGRLLHLIRAGRERAAPADVKTIEKMYADAAVGAGRSFQPQTGFRYMGLQLAAGQTVGWSEPKKLEDGWCFTCDGDGEIKCPNREFHRGRNRSSPTACPVCQGQGSIECRDCFRGVERGLRWSPILHLAPGASHAPGAVRSSVRGLPPGPASGPAPIPPSAPQATPGAYRPPIARMPQQGPDVPGRRPLNAARAPEGTTEDSGEVSLSRAVRGR